MSKNTPAPVPAGKQPDTDATPERPAQDESGKTSAPQSSQGLDEDSTQPDGNLPIRGQGKKRGEPRPM